jgi:kynurenine formamidase
MESRAIEYMTTLSNWGRWGTDDQRGTLNLIDPSTRDAAARLVRDGNAVSCAWDLQEAQRFMKRTGEGLRDPDRPTPPKRWAVASEHLDLEFHSRSVTHLDAPSHMSWDGRCYNDVPAARVTAEWGALSLAVTEAATGVLTRGVLLDLPALFSLDHLPSDFRVEPEHLEEAERRQGVRVETGDALLIRLGQGWIRRALGFDAALEGPRPGCHHSCLPWFHERSISLLGSDSTNDPEPVGEEELPVPIHVVGLVAMGLWLLDNVNLEDLVDHCRLTGRYEFLFVVSPLRLVGATGSPVNPLAVF